MVKMIVMHLSLLFSILVLTLISDGMIHHIQTDDEFLNMRSLNEHLGVLYYHHLGRPDEFKSRTVIVMEAADSRMDEIPDRFMVLATVNCSSKEITKKVCSSDKREFLLYSSKADHPEKFKLRTLHDADAFISEMVSFIYSDEIHIVNDEKQLDDLLDKCKKDVIFTSFYSFGSMNHYEYIVFFLSNRHNYEFAFTTDGDLANQLGKNKAMPNGLWYFRCSESVEISKKSEVFSDLNVIEASSIESFINNCKIPLVSLMLANGSTIYDGIELLNVLYVFIESDEEAERMTKMVTNVITRCKGNGIQLRGVILHKGLHYQIMQDVFGMSKETILPTVMIETGRNRNPEALSESGAREIEAFIPDEDLTEENLFGFVYKLVKDRATYDNSIVAMNYIHCITGNEWYDLSKMNHNTLIGACTQDKENEECRIFKRNFRHIVRIMNAENALNFDYVYIYSKFIYKSDDGWVGFDTPSVTLFMDGEMRKLDSKNPDLIDILNWINSHLQLNLPLLPRSGSDHVSLPRQSQYNENAEEIEGDDEDIQPYQEDEIALSSVKVRRASFYDDNSAFSLTDKTFQETVNTSKLLFALFYLPHIDDISFMLQPIIAAINKNVESTHNSSLVETKVAKINCENEYMACNDIVTFPTIRFYSEGKVLGQYNGLLEEESLMRSLRAYQHPGLPKLTEDTLPKFITTLAQNSASQMTVLGWFHSEDEDFQLFRKVCDKFFTKITFAYAIGKSTSELFPKITQISTAPQTSTVIAFVQNQVSRVLSRDQEQFTENTLDEFLIKAQVPVFGELTVENFPVYKSFNKCLLVLFLYGENKINSIAWKVILQLAQETTMEYVMLTWMDTNTVIGKEIRRSYLGMQKEKHEDIVFVNFTKAEVYHYPGSMDLSDVNDVINTEKLYAWIQQCRYGEVRAAKYLNVLNWKPLRQGFDFLHLIDNNKRSPGDDGSSDDELDEENSNKGETDGFEYHVDYTNKKTTKNVRRISSNVPLASRDGRDSDPQTSPQEAHLHNDFDDDDQGIKQSMLSGLEIDNEFDVEIHKQREEL